MKTKQEQIKAMHKVFCNACKPKLSKDCVCPWQDRAERCYNCETFCEIFYKAGYDDVSEYKAEIERLRQEVRDTDKMARNTIEQYRSENKELENALKQSEDNYSRAFERLKAQEREIERLSNENCELTKRLRARLTCDFVRTAQINLLNKVKEKLDNAPNGWAYTGYIDDLIEEIEK